MKRRDLEKILLKLGWSLKRNGSKHDIWWNGEDEEVISRHSEIKEFLAQKILKTAQGLKVIKNENRRKNLEKQN